MKDMIQVTKHILKPRCFNPNGFEKTEVHGQKINKILHMTADCRRWRNRSTKLDIKTNVKPKHNS